MPLPDTPSVGIAMGNEGEMRSTWRRWRLEATAVGPTQQVAFANRCGGPCHDHRLKSGVAQASVNREPADRASGRRDSVLAEARAGREGARKSLADSPTPLIGRARQGQKGRISEPGSPAVGYTGWQPCPGALKRVPLPQFVKNDKHRGVGRKPLSMGTAPVAMSRDLAFDPAHRYPQPQTPSRAIKKFDGGWVNPLTRLPPPTKGDAKTPNSAVAETKTAVSAGMFS